MADVFDIHIGDMVKIALLRKPTEHVQGKIFKIIPTEGDEKIVVLQDGNKGKVMDVINSLEVIKDRIMTENQHTENKENFSEDVMKTKSIPYAIQSFLNSDGGYLYIGVKDTGTLKERLVGLEYDFESINKDSEQLVNDKLCDKLEARIRDSLEKYLISNTQIGQLLEFNFRDIEGVQILEIAVKKSTKPVYYQHLAKTDKKPKKFQIYYNNSIVTERSIDDFYIRSGNRKKLLETHQEFYEYAHRRFEN